MSTWTRENHEAARARCEAATAGPWMWSNAGGIHVRLAQKDDALVMGFARQGFDGAQPVLRTSEGIPEKAGRGNLYDYPDAAFIAHARSEVPALLDEIERLRPDLTGPAPEDRDEKVARFARRLWAAAIEVSEGDTTPVPAFEDMTPRERDALTAITDSVVSAITVLLSSRQPAPEENL